MARGAANSVGSSKEKFLCRGAAPLVLQMHHKKPPMWLSSGLPALLCRP